MLFPHVNIVTVALFAALLVGFFVVSRVSAHRKRQCEMAALGETWGQPLRRSRADRSVAARTPSTAPPGTTRLDDVTWSDLDMARVFTRVDRTLTSVGAQMLHRMLRCPAIDPETIERRRALVVAVAADPDARTRMQRVLVALGDKQGWEAWFALSGALPILPGPVWLLRLLPLMMLGTLGAAIALDHLLLFIAAVVLGLALPLIHALTHRRIGHHLEAVADVGRVLDAAVALHGVAPPEVRALVDDVLDRARPLHRTFGKRVSTASTGGLGGAPEMAAEYGKAFGLTELVPYQRATRAISRHRADYDRILDVVGEIDAALSIAYLHAHDEDLRGAVVDPAAPGLSATGLRHPLVDDAVGNDIDLGPGLLITGSNMAGKSTLLRSIGVNLVLAQAIGLVAAERWRARPLRIATAMGAHDDLAAGVSLYRAEVDRIHTLVQRAGGDHLFLLDEAFCGTNPHERIAASAAVLVRLGQRDLVVAATHDRALCELLESQFTLGFFTEEVHDDDVVFDYRLRPGVLQTTNAIALLERAGFPADLVAEARRLAAGH